MIFGIRKLIVITILFSMLFFAFNLENRNQVISQQPFDYHLLWLTVGLVAATALVTGWTILHQDSHLAS